MVVVFNRNPNSNQGPLRTPFTDQFDIKHPISLAGMNIAAGPNLAAAVIKAGGFGCLGGCGFPKSPEYDTVSPEVFYEEFMAHQTPEKIQTQIRQVKERLPEYKDGDLPLGIDILLPQIGGSARKTNYDYTTGTADAIIDVAIKEGIKLFVSALGAPSKEIVDKLHRHKILVACNVGHPRHAAKALAAGCDMIIATGTEGGGHVSDVSGMVLWPMILDLCRGKRSPMTGKPIIVLAGGGIHDSRGLAATLAMGADGVWVGTRFVACKESGASDGHQKDLLRTKLGDTVRTTIFTGRPMRVQSNEYIRSWESKPDAIKALTSQGHIPALHELKQVRDSGAPMSPMMEQGIRAVMLGQAAGAINEILSAKQIIDEMVSGCVLLYRRNDRIRCRL